MDSTVRNNQSGKRFEVEVDGHLAILEYVLAGGSLALTHTEVPSELEGQGLGSKIVKAALDFAKDQGLKVLPQCPFVSGYIERHKEYEQLVQ